MSISETTLLTKLAELEQLLPSLTQQYHRLAVVVGRVGSGKTPLLKELCRKHAIPYLNVNLALSQRLLELTSQERPLRVRRLLDDAVAGAVSNGVNEQKSDVIALDNIELLFDPALHQDPLALLQSLSRNRTFVVAWGGTYDEKRTLSYAEPGHPEYRRYERPEGVFIDLPGSRRPE